MLWFHPYLSALMWFLVIVFWTLNFLLTFCSPASQKSRVICTWARIIADYCSTVALIRRGLIPSQPGACNCIPMGIPNSPECGEQSSEVRLLPLHCNCWLVTSVY